MVENAELSDVQRRGRQIVDEVETRLRGAGVQADRIEASLSLLRDQLEALVAEAREEGEGHGKRLRDWELRRLVQMELGLYVTPDGAWEYSLAGYFSESFDSRETPCWMPSPAGTARPRVWKSTARVRGRSASVWSWEV